MGATGLAVGGACGCAAAAEVLLLVGSTVVMVAAAVATGAAEGDAVAKSEADLADDDATAGTEVECAAGLADSDSASFCRCLS